MGDCTGQEGEAACQFVCQWQFGRENENYLTLVTWFVFYLTFSPVEIK
jgi:hypothetical protein